MQVLQEELRSTVLRIGLLDAQLPKLPEGIILAYSVYYRLYTYGLIKYILTTNFILYLEYFRLFMEYFSYYNNWSK